MSAINEIILRERCRGDPLLARLKKEQRANKRMKEARYIGKASFFYI